MTTPMRRQYLAMKSQYPDCILFFRLGDFYETFDEDARIVARVCDVVLTSRPVGSNQRVPLAGVPYHSVDGYIARLVEAGYKVAIAEQTSEPGNGLVEREVRQVVTKGTAIEPNLLDEKRNNYLVAVTFNSRGDQAGIAYCDVSTGEFAATQIEAPGSLETERKVAEELSRLKPSELIIADWQPEETGLEPHIAALGALVSQVEAWQVEIDTARQSLERHFLVTSLDGFGLRATSQAIRAAAAVLAYVQEMQPAALAQLAHLHSYETGAFMTLDESTRRNLELTETLRDAASKGSLLGVLDETLTPMGGRLLRRWLGQPLLDVAAIQRRLDALQALHDHTAVRLEVRNGLRQIGDLERWTNRVVQGAGLPRDLVGLRETLRMVPELRRILGTENPAPASGDARSEPNHLSPVAALLPERQRAVFSPLPPCADILSLLEAAIADEPPATLAHPGLIREGYSQELDELVHRSRHAKDWVANLERSERERLDIKSLKVGYNKVFGYYIEVTHAHQDKVPDDYIRKQTLTNAERYITPELKEYESLILNADERRLELEQQIFRELCREVAGAAHRLLQLAAGLAALDVYAALAEVALARRYVRPQVDEGPGIRIAAGRHPVVELASTGEPFVPNDTDLTPDAAIHILTGPNMSGKCVAGDTLLLTEYGLCPIQALRPSGTTVGQFSPLAVQLDGPLGTVQSSHFYWGGAQDTIRIRTRLGFELEGTPEHRIWVRSPGGVERWCRLDELQPGDWVAIRQGSELWGSQTRLAGPDTVDPDLHTGQRRPPPHLTLDLAYLMGLLVGGGTLTEPEALYFAADDDEVAAEFTRTVTGICEGQRVVFGHWRAQAGPSGRDYALASTQIRRFLARNGLDYVPSWQKEVPACIRQAPRPYVVSFLRGLFVTAGTAGRSCGHVHLTLTSPVLMRQVHMLLLNMGILACLHRQATGRHPTYVLSISGSQALRFRQEIGFRRPDQAQGQALASHLSMPDGGLPHLVGTSAQMQEQFVRRPEMGLGRKTRLLEPLPVAFQHAMAHESFSTYSLQDCDIGRRQRGERSGFGQHDELVSPESAAVQGSDHFYDRIEHVTTGRSAVYDLSVPDTHAFTAEGFISHNSTYLRQTALITLLAQIGSFVPAESAQIGVVDRIFTRIGASDEIHRGQSTFMVEMVETANILNHATRRSLLILDEIGRGTSTYDGLAIAWAVVEHVHNHPELRAKTLFATHYHELTDLAERLPHVVNFHVAVDDAGDQVVFLRRILPGRADRSYGVHVAQMAGLPRSVIRRAEEILEDLERSGAAGPARLLEIGDKRKGRPAAAVQVGLFAETHPAVVALRELDVNSLTPLEALNRLYELQHLANGL